MEVLGDNVVVKPGLVRGDEYSFLIESKTSLFISNPDSEASEPRRGLPLFFLAMSIAWVVGIHVNRQGGIFVLPLLIVATASLWSLTRSYVKPAQRDTKWRLYLGSSEQPVLIYSSYDVAIFEAKRNEIEQTLLGRPLNEEV